MIMINSTANIYVSVGQALRRESDESRGYRREQHTYLISVEPHHIHIPGIPQHGAAITHFEAVKDPSSEQYGLVKYTSKDPPSIIGNILIAESANTTVDKVHKVLLEKLATATRADDSYGSDEGEHRMKIFVHALQDHDIVVKFKVDEFSTWTHSYLMDRLSNEAPALIAYPRAHKDNEQKASRHKFWVTNSMRQKTRTNSSGEATMYGGRT